MKKEGEKKIELTIKRDKNNVLCTILDNGVGINSTKCKLWTFQSI